MSHVFRWTAQKILKRLALIEPLVYIQKHPLPPFRYTKLDSPLQEPPVGFDVNDSTWEVIQPHSYWGAWKTNFAMRGSFEIPANWDAAIPVALYLPMGDSGDFSHPEALTYIDGRATASTDRHHHEIRLADDLRDGKRHLLALHGWTGLGGWSDDDPHTRLYMRECAVVQIHQPTRDLIVATHVSLEVAEILGEEHPVTNKLYNALDAAFKTLDTRDPVGTDAFYESVPAALEVLQAGIADAGAPMEVDIIGAGHAHIDVAWLWTLGQTRRKAGRTFSNVLRLMEQFPDFKFTQSQPQLYQYTLETYPELFAQIQQRVEEGRWELIGGTWVEPDCNTIGAESLARQFLLGRSFFRQHFGTEDTPLLWLPDTFGYSWALPQLMQQAGIQYFVTHKMSWNQYNQMPEQMLWWQGLDGTRILTYFLTTPEGNTYLPHATTYNALMSVKQAFGTWKNFRQKGVHNELLMAYGYGDGGGGPTREMLENMAALHPFPGAPRVRPGTVREFMDHIAETASDQLPVWNGEFYLEYHRGTFTSQSRNKRSNRKSEFLLHDAEFLAAWASLTTGYEYPHDTFQKAWELVCLNQFHDILPGSSIGEVYVDSARDYQTIMQLGSSALESAITALASTLPAEADLIAINPTSFGGARVGLFSETLPENAQIVDGITGTPLIQQTTSEGTLLELPDSAPYALLPLRIESAAPTFTNELVIEKTATGLVLENGLVRVEFNPQGEIIRLWDKEAAREVLPDGASANVLLAFEDRPMQFDAWDIDIYYEDRTERVDQVESLTIIESGPIRAGFEVRRPYRDSMIVQKVFLQRNSKQLDFDTWIDWHEQHILLKAAFPLNVLSPYATFDIQWGNVQRPTHRNTSWERARFETCAHKWVDLSESNYGAALLNDCKYGHDVLDHTVRLTLLKSATSPDPHADQGEHHMTYSLLPHTGDWRNGVVPAAYHLNNPVILRRVQAGNTAESPRESFVRVNSANAIIETVKQAQDGDGIIVRLYEHQRARGKVQLQVGFPLQAAYRCNLLEENELALEADGNSVTFELTPYQIMTLRLVPKS
ncbi:MAG: putative alpha-mannosidase [Chloroflexi bacterium OLB15]|nr:MAG: putative alpha-mannosidase [Chloroflexi bacterium OLB15]